MLCTKKFLLNSSCPTPKDPIECLGCFQKSFVAILNAWGDIETLTERPHPTRKGDFEVLNGHARLEALRELRLRTVQCDVWEIGDLESRLFLATLNRIQCSEAPELRMSLPLDLLKATPKEETAKHVPETRDNLDQLKQLERTLTKALRE